MSNKKYHTGTKQMVLVLGQKQMRDGTEMVLVKANNRRSWALQKDLKEVTHGSKNEVKQ